MRRKPKAQITSAERQRLYRQTAKGKKAAAAYRARVRLKALETQGERRTYARSRYLRAVRDHVLKLILSKVERRGPSLYISMPDLKKIYRNAEILEYVKLQGLNPADIDDAIATIAGESV